MNLVHFPGIRSPRRRAAAHTRTRDNLTELRHLQGRYVANHLVCENWGGLQVMGTPRNSCAFGKPEPEADDERFMSKHGTLGA